MAFKIDGDHRSPGPAASVTGFCRWRKPVRAEHDALSAKRKGPFDGFEVWDRAGFVFTHPAAAEKPEVRSASNPSGPVGLDIVKPPGSD